jgi:hypothetical protein
VTIIGAQYVLTSELRVDLPPAEAWRLFTPRGEQAWVRQWRPHFPYAAPDDTAPGTVFETDAHGQITTWVVVDSQPGRRISYARFTPQSRAGTVAVVVDAAGDGASDGASRVTVTYQLTALTEAAAEELAQFAAGYPTFIRSWQDAIAGHLTSP